MVSNRRKFITDLSKAGLGVAFLSNLSCDVNSTQDQENSDFFNISLAEWSVRELIRSGRISNLEFPGFAKSEFGIHAVEYVSQFFEEGEESDSNYLQDLKDRTDSEGIRNVLIMVDMWGPEGTLASPDQSRRKQAAANHHKWVDAAKYLGCHAIRVNASGYEDASYEDAMNYFADGLSHLVEYGKQNDISILVENHGGLSSNGRWLADVMKMVGDDFCGTLPDFGNFRVSREEGIFYDPLVGLSEIMPFAKGVSAKSNDFGPDGNETTIDFPRMMDIVKIAGFTGYIGIEWGGGGSRLSPEQGIKNTKSLLEKLRTQLT